MIVAEPLISSWPAGPDRANEDVAVATRSMAVVADGAGLPKVVRQGCSHPVQWYSKTLARTLHGFLGDPSRPVRTALREAIRATTAAHGAGCTLMGGSPSATVAACRVNGADLEYVVLGDASILFALADGTAREVNDDRLDQVVTPRKQKLLAEWERTGEFTGDQAWLEAHRRTAEVLRNVPGGFWVCQDDEYAANEAIVGRVALAGLRGMVLATDGAVRGTHLLGIHNTDVLATRLVDGDHAGVFAEIRAAEERRSRDLGRRRIKVHDDMTVVSLRTSPSHRAA